jgi:hypothetical protein
MGALVLRGDAGRLPLADEVLHSGHAAKALAHTNQERQGRLNDLQDLAGLLDQGEVGG